MTVADLIRILQTYPPEKRVLLQDGQTGSYSMDILHEVAGESVVLFAEYGEPDLKP